TITAMAIDDDGLHGQASISIRVRGPNQPPAIAITSPADGTSVPAGTPTALTATVTDDFDTNLAGQVRWTSDRDGALGNGPRTATARSAAARPSRPAGSRSARTRSRPPPATGATSSVRRR